MSMVDDTDGIRHHPSHQGDRQREGEKERLEEWWMVMLVFGVGGCGAGDGT